MLLAILVVLLGFGGWRYWQARNTRIDLAAEARYEQLLQSLDQGQLTPAQLSAGTAMADKLSQDYPTTPYADQAQLLAARIDVQGNRLPSAATRLSHVLQHT